MNGMDWDDDNSMSAGYARRGREFDGFPVGQLAARGGNSVWHPIETAPKDRRILGWDGAEMNTLDWEPPVKASWGELPGSWCQVSDSGRASSFYPTHWMPLPEPPTE